MSLVLIDGLEDLTSWVTSGIATVAAGRTGNGITLSTSSTMSYTLPSASETDTLTIGFAFKVTTLPGSTTGFLTLRSDAGSTTHLSLRLLADGSMDVVRSTGTALSPAVATAAGLIAADTWNYLEVQAKLHDTTGTVTVRLNGVQVAAGTALDTKNSGSKAVFDTVRLSRVSTINTFVDDLYLMSGSGDAFQGDCVVETLYPTGNGNANQWVGSDGNSTDNYLLVDEAGVPDTADWVAASTSGYQDLYALTDLVRTLGPVLGVYHAAYATDVDAAASHQIKLVNRRASDTKSAAVTLPAPVGSSSTAVNYSPVSYVLALDPETSAAWTVTNVNALQGGVEVV